LLGLLGLVAGLMLVTPALSRRFLFPVSGLVTPQAPSDFVRHALAADDGEPVHALELPAVAGAHTIVMFHGNRETVEHCAGLARVLHRRGFGVLLVEYRGYGASRGEDPTEEGLYRDARAALDMLAERGLGPERIVLWGTSLGTGVAAEMARAGRGAHLILVTPYTSIPDVVVDAVPFVPAHRLMPDHFDTLAKTPSITVPTLVVHGDADEVVPFWMGQRLVESIRGARLLRLEGGSHGDWFVRGGDRLLDEVERLASAAPRA
jgi:pimeloyl-ACP methyl ester carboxylesterase